MPFARKLIGMPPLMWGLWVLIALGGCNAPPAGNTTGGQEPVDTTAQYEARLDELVQRFGNPERNMWQRPEWLLRRIGPLAGRTVADIGAGSGYFALPMAGLAHHVIAVDVDTGWVDYLRQQALAHSLQNLEIRLTQPDDPRLAPAEVDIILLANTYPYIENRVMYFQRLRPALRPGGALWVLDFLAGPTPDGPPDSLKIPPATVQAELQAAGFRAFVWDSTTLPYQYLLRAE